jgi:hypothetical protein
MFFTTTVGHKHTTTMKPNHLQSLDPRTQQAKHKEQIEKKALLDRAFDRIIGSQLHKIKAANNAPTEQDETTYQETLERERAAASQRKTKKLSKEHAELARTTGLSGQVVALMAQVEESKKRKSKKRSRRDYSDDSSSSSSGSSSSSSEDSYERRKRRHKEKRRKRKYESRVDGDSSHCKESRDQRRRTKEKKRKRSKSHSPKPEGASTKRDTSRLGET